MRYVIRDIQQDRKPATGVSSVRRNVYPAQVTDTFRFAGFSLCQNVSETDTMRPRTSLLGKTCDQVYGKVADMRQPQVSDTEIAEQLFREMYDRFWHDGRRWWRNDGNTWTHREARHRLDVLLDSLQLPDHPYWQRGIRILATSSGRSRILQQTQRLLPAPNPKPVHPDRPGWR